MSSKSRTKAGTSRASAADKRKAFVEFYFANGENATQAAISAGFSAKTAGVTGAKMLKDPRVLAEITRRRSELCANLEISTERILKERARLAFYDPRKLFDGDGKPIPIHLLDDDTAAALAGLDVHEEYAGTGEDRVFIGYTKKYKLPDKNSSLTALEKIKGMYEQDNKQTGEAAGTAAGQVVAAGVDAAMAMLSEKLNARRG